MHAFTVNLLTHNAHKNVMPTQANTASKRCTFISVKQENKNPLSAIRLTGITVTLNKIATEIFSLSIQVLIFSKRRKLRFLDLSVYFLVFWNKEEDIKP